MAFRSSSFGAGILFNDIGNGCGIVCNGGGVVKFIPNAELLNVEVIFGSWLFDGGGKFGGGCCKFGWDGMKFVDCWFIGGILNAGRGNEFWKSSNLFVVLPNPSGFVLVVVGPKRFIDWFGNTFRCSFVDDGGGGVVIIKWFGVWLCRNLWLSFNGWRPASHSFFTSLPGKLFRASSTFFTWTGAFCANGLVKVFTGSCCAKRLENVVFDMIRSSWSWENGCFDGSDTMPGDGPNANDSWEFEFDRDRSCPNRLNWDVLLVGNLLVDEFDSWSWPNRFALFVAKLEPIFDAKRSWLSLPP